MHSINSKLIDPQIFLFSRIRRKIRLHRESNPGQERGRHPIFHSSTWVTVDTLRLELGLVSYSFGHNNVWQKVRVSLFVCQLAWLLLHVVFICIIIYLFIYLFAYLLLSIHYLIIFINFILIQFLLFLLSRFQLFNEFLISLSFTKYHAGLVFFTFLSTKYKVSIVAAVY